MKAILKGLYNKRGRKDEAPSMIPVNELLPAQSAIILKNSFGFLARSDGKIEIIPIREHPVWKKFSPLFLASEVEEIWLFEGKTVATIKNFGRISIKGSPSPEELENLIISIIAATGVKVDMRKPRGVVDVDDWRVSIQLSSGGQTQIVATRLSSVPPLKELIDPITAARLMVLLLRPAVIVILGPPGSGKSTLLNSLVGEIARIFPNLHLAVVEKYRELVFKEGWFSWILSENLVDGVRWAMRYFRPDLIVVGEIMAEDFWSIVEPSRSGLPTITTFHSPTIRKAVKVLSDSLRAQLGYGDENSVLQYVDVFIQTQKRVTPRGIERGVESIFISDGQRLIPFYAAGKSMSDEEFLQALPEQIYVGPTVKILTQLLSEYGVSAREYRG
ncbi:MAG: ATPase, T2SS/T4P/T4SS family [Infirmifilum sp.]